MELLLLPLILFFEWLWPSKVRDVAMSEKGRRVLRNPKLAEKVFKAIQKMNTAGDEQATVEGVTVKRVRIS